jgi:hypothetical protein
MVHGEHHLSAELQVTFLYNLHVNSYSPQARWICNEVVLCCDADAKVDELLSSKTLFA